MTERRIVGPGFHAAVYRVVRRIPAGRVSTYGDVGAALGSPRVARQVGWALAALRDASVPWHRVINARGTISFKGDTPRGLIQQQRLEAEGVEFDPQGRVDLKRLRWNIAELADEGFDPWETDDDG